MITARAFATLLCAVFLVGCDATSNANADPWIGEWRDPNNNRLCFLPGGKLEYRARGVTIARGTYTRNGENSADTHFTSTGPRGAPVLTEATIKLSEAKRSFQYNKEIFNRVADM